MHKTAYQKLFGVGFSTELIDKIDQKGLTFSALKGFSVRRLLLQGFTELEAKFIAGKVNREPITPVVLDALLEKCGTICCYCADGNTSRPYQVHHMEEYHKTQDNREENLLIVCPTHHVSIHTNRLTTETQKAVKRNWEALWSIAGLYQSRGLGFPFGAIEAIDYSVEGTITDIFRFLPPVPSLCCLLTEGTIKEEARQILLTKYHLILAGASGSGKTTLATGIAGTTGHAVFKYTASGQDPLESTREIQQFLSVTTRAIVLIIDDANTMLGPPQIELVLRSATAHCTIIVVNTRNTMTSEGNIEQHFSHSVMPISWNEMKGMVISNLLVSDAAIVQYLRGHELAIFNGNPVGFGIMDTRLETVLKHAANDVETVWEFIFTLASGRETIWRLRKEHFDKGRIDLVLLLIGVNQIARVEEGTTLDEILELFEYHPALNHHAVPQREWMEEKMTELIQARLVKQTRGRFNTVHRQFAAQYIEACYMHTPGDATILIRSRLDKPEKIKEIIILWSWLSNLSARRIVQQWKTSRVLEDWITMGGYAAAHSFAVFARYLDNLHSIDGAAKRALPVILENNLDVIAGYINQADTDMFYYLQKSSVCLRYHASSLWQALLDKIDQPLLREHIRKADVYDIRQLDRTFYSITLALPEWVIDFCTGFTLQDFRLIAEKTPAGDAQQLFELAGFVKRYIGDFKKSEYVFYAHQMCRILKDTPISSWNFHLMERGLEELRCHEELNRLIASAIDPAQFRSDLYTLAPNYWETPIALLDFLSICSYDLIEAWLEEIDVDRLILHLQSYGPENVRGKRIMYAMFAFASVTKQQEITKGMYPLVYQAVKNAKPHDEHERFLELLSRFDPVLAQQICDELQVSVTPEPAGGYWGMTYEETVAFIKKIEQLEESGEDYRLGSVLLTRQNLPNRNDQ